jgi:hypothetical protein
MRLAVYGRRVAGIYRLEEAPFRGNALVLRAMEYFALDAYALCSVSSRVPLSVEM